MKFLDLLARRRTVLALPTTSILLYGLSGLFGLQARAQGANRLWRINASSFATGIGRFFHLVEGSASKGGSFPVSALMWYFPLNPTAPDGFQRLIDRGQVNFDEATATSKAQYDTLDFKDDAIGNVSIILQESIVANYKREPGSITFNFDAPEPQIIIWKIPSELGVPKSLNVRALKFSANSTSIVLSNTVNKDLLEMQLYVDPPGGPAVKVASVGRLGTAEALALLAQNTTVCCKDNCARDDGAIGGDKQLSERWSIIRKSTGANAGQCSLRRTDKDSPPLDNDYVEIAGGFLTLDAASDAMSTKYRKECSLP